MTAIAHALRALLFASILAAAVAHGAAPPRFDIDVRFDLAASRIIGRVVIDAQAPLVIHRGALTIVSIASRGRELALADPLPDPLTIAADGPVAIEYEATLNDPEGDFIDANRLVLREIWYPVARGTYRFRLTALLPPQFVAVSEGRAVRHAVSKTRVAHTFELAQPQRDWDGVTLVASRQWVTREASAGEVALTVHLNRDDAERLEAIVEQTQRHVRGLEALLGPLPYTRLSVVEHPLPVRYSLAMPGYVLLSQESVREPSDEESALAHEIAHQWFGNGVLAAYEEGNWSEGLATYFGDHLAIEERGGGWALRQRYMAGYQNNVGTESALPLSGFTSADDRPSGYVGYDKCALVFHMLRRHLGDARFFAGIRRFVTEHRFAVAGWRDIQAAFEASSGEDLAWFFAQWVERDDVPEIAVKGGAVDALEARYVLNLTLTQPEPAFALALPLTVEFDDGARETRLLELTRSRASYRLALDREPIRAIVDAGYDVFRALSAREFPPSFDRLMARSDLLIVARPEDTTKFAALISALRSTGAHVAWHRLEPWRRVMPPLDDTRSIVYLGDAPPALMRLAPAPRTRAGFSVEVLEHPRSPGEVVVLARAVSKAEVEAALARLLTGREYSLAEFEAGTWTRYARTPGARGMLAFERRAPQ